ncbi:hypothetical protein K440DRAFT_646653 [Wilcoxina mikolae CBS 423.85]|nr:hypothetical protein K440DRAFT_646653 [Wilcoxina mikolae CBS 423.85]
MEAVQRQADGGDCGNGGSSNQASVHLSPDPNGGRHTSGSYGHRCSSSTAAARHDNVEVQASDGTAAQGRSGGSGVQALVGTESWILHTGEGAVEIEKAREVVGAEGVIAGAIGARAMGGGEARGDKGAVGSTVGAMRTIKFVREAMPVEVGVVGAIMEAEVREAGEVVRAETAISTIGIVREAVRAVGVIEDRGAREVFRASSTVEVVRRATAGARNLNMARASTVVIFAVIQSLSLPNSNVLGSIGCIPSLVITFLQGRFGSACSSISVLSYSHVIPYSISTALM